MAYQVYTSQTTPSNHLYATMMNRRHLIHSYGPLTLSLSANPISPCLKGNYGGEGVSAGLRFTLLYIGSGRLCAKTAEPTIDW